MYANRPAADATTSCGSGPAETCATMVRVAGSTMLNTRSAFERMSSAGDGVGPTTTVPCARALEPVALRSSATPIITKRIRWRTVPPMIAIIREPVTGRNQRCVVKLLRSGHRDAEMRASRAHVLVEPLHRLGHEVRAREEMPALIHDLSLVLRRSAEHAKERFLRQLVQVNAVVFVAQHVNLDINARKRD